MDKLQTLNSFWSGFELKAYDETSVPDSAVLPYITYEVAEDDFDHPIAVTASVWYRTTAWTEPIAKVKEIEQAIGRGGKMLSYDGGAFWIKKATPWAQHLRDPDDDSVRRIILNLEIEYID